MTATLQHRICETKSSATNGRTIVARISTTDVDRHGDVMLPSGLDLTDFWKVPTVLLEHDHKSLPIGRVVRNGIAKEPHGIEATIVMHERPKSLPANIEWVPDTILDLFKQGAPLGFSYGWRMKPGGGRIATLRDRKAFGDNVKHVVSEWTIHEISVVTIPANQNAIALAVKNCGIAPGDWTREALGLKGRSVVRVLPHQPKRLVIEAPPMVGRRLRID